MEARGEVTEKETISDPVSSLSKKKLVLKVGKLTKHNEKLKQEVT